MPHVADHPSGSNENNSWADLTTREKTDRLIDKSDGNKIYPLTFPKPGASPSLIENLADNIRSSGEQVSETGYDITTAWAGLTGCYQAPHQEELYEVLDPVSSDGDRVMYGMNRAANALEDFAEILEGIQSRWDTLITDSYEFRARVAERGDEWRDAEGLLSFGDSDAVEENNALVQRGSNLIEEYEEAERDCANLINSNVVNRTRFEGAPSSGELDDDVFYHGHEDDLSDLVTEWGVEATTDQHWWVDAGTAAWDFGVGAVEGLGGAVGFHSSEGWFNMSWGDAFVEYHEDNIQSALGLVGLYDDETGYGWSGWDNVGQSWKDLAHSVVPWEEWGERPWYVIGTAALNIGATVAGAALSLTGAGAVVGVPLMAWRGSAILDGMGSGRGGSGDAGIDGADLDVGLPPGQRYGGSGSPLVQIDANTFDTGDFTPEQLTGMRDSLSRVQNLESGGGSRPGRPIAPVAHDPFTDRSPRGDADRSGTTGDREHHSDPTSEQLRESDRLLNDTESPSGRPSETWEGGPGDGRPGTRPDDTPAPPESTSGRPDTDMRGETPSTRNDAEDGGGGDTDASTGGHGSGDGGKPPPPPPPDGHGPSSPPDDGSPRPPTDGDLTSEQRAQQAHDLISRDAVTFADDMEASRYGANHWNDYADNLPSDQRQSLHRYTTDPPEPSNYVEMNKYLRGIEDPPDLGELKGDIANIDRALEGNPVPEDVVVTRGTGLGHIDVEPWEMSSQSSGFTDQGYMSTSLGGPAPAFAGNDAVLHMRVPEGTPALWAERVSAYGAGERELLLGRGTTYHVRDAIQDSRGQWQIYAEVEPPKPK